MTDRRDEDLHKLEVDAIDEVEPLIGGAAAKPVERDKIEAALWFNNLMRETDYENAKEGIRRAIARAAQQHSLILAPVEWTELTPGDDRCPDPPKEWTGQPRLLLGTAPVKRVTSAYAKSRFSAQLTVEEREHLRSLTRQHYAVLYPELPLLTDAQCDQYIDDSGKRAADRQLEQAIDDRIH